MIYQPCNNIPGILYTCDSLRHNADPNLYRLQEKQGWQKSNQTDGVQNKGTSTFSNFSLSSCKSASQTEIEPKLMHMAASLGLTRYLQA